MGPFGIVEVVDVAAEGSAGFGHIVIGPQIDFLIFDSAPEPFDTPWQHQHPPPNPVPPAAKSPNNLHPNTASEPSLIPPSRTTIMAQL